MIELKAIAKSYGNNNVLKSINVTIPSGIVYGLVGKNGAGKTTLLNIISGISDLSSGQCIIDGKIVKKGYSQQGLSYLPDLPSFFDYLTVEEYIKFILGTRSKSAIQFDDYLDRFMLNKKATIKTLSRGNKQKVGLLIATITNPKILLLDEPTSALDPVGRKEVISIIKELKQCGTTIVFSTHILSDLELVCDKIAFLQSGVIKKEIDMTSISVGDSFEILLKNGIMPESIMSSFQSYKVDFIENGIIVHNIEQSSLFDIVTSNNYEIASIKKTSGIDLENTMMEVLGE